MKYRFNDGRLDEYVIEYNSLVREYEHIDSKLSGYSFHHILPRHAFPELCDDPRNHLFLPVMLHIRMHYLLWKHDWKYCAAFWFCYVYFHKNFDYNISEQDVERLKADMRQYRKMKKELKYEQASHD